MRGEYMASGTRLSSKITVKRYRELELNDDRTAIGEFLRQRFAERYFQPIEFSQKKHGFLIMAVCCLLIETLESFHQGKRDGKGSKTFSAFFAHDTELKVFGKDLGQGPDWFYKNIRCGILHQSETKGGWRILRKGELLNVSDKTINATKFLAELSRAINDYAKKLQTDDVLWGRFKTKMKFICDNCT